MYQNQSTLSTYTEESPLIQDYKPTERYGFYEWPVFKIKRHHGRGGHMVA